MMPRAIRRNTQRFADPAVGAAFGAYPVRLRSKLMSPGVGRLKETLKWGQPSYLTAETGSGSTIRIDRVKPADKPKGGSGDGERYAIYFHCQTTLVPTFRQLYPEAFDFSGNRAILLDPDRPLPEAELRHCIALALTYHLKGAKRYL